MSKHNENQKLPGSLARATLSFSGSGDSGDIDTFEFYDANGNELDFLEALDDLVNDLFEEAVSNDFAGYEIDGGGGGDLCFDVYHKDGKVYFVLNLDESSLYYCQREVDSAIIHNDKASIDLTSSEPLHIEVEFSGIGDSGSIDEINITRKNGGALDDEDPEWESAIEDAVYDLLEKILPGWEIDEGSCGTLVFSHPGGGAQQAVIDVDESQFTSFYEESYEQSLAPCILSCSADNFDLSLLDDLPAEVVAIIEKENRDAEAISATLANQGGAEPI
ncbi:MAG: hypothetical protein IBX50_08540 [Marinospirillum sp.]|uniref:hypothetical protein n=1 Tax=Marinospirillum sp. TaxID=2183934 RepID=UPI0019EEF056|nr:hypothetical protein [Marinospirillum sp.]MBE0506754.1 hypothetical protein [Marinospirillum sp.]